MILYRVLSDWNGPLRLRGLLDLAASAYGSGMVILIMFMILGVMSADQFVKVLSLLLFANGVVLIDDGVLSVRSRIDRTWGKLIHGGRARLLGMLKIQAGSAALLLCTIGLSV